MSKKIFIFVLVSILLGAGLVFAGGQQEKTDGKITLGLSYDSLESAWLVINHAAVVSVMAEGHAAKQN